MKSLAGWDTLNREERIRTLDLFEKEIQIHASLKHPNIVDFLGVTLQPDVSSVMELACVNLSEFGDFGEGNHCVYNLRQLLARLDDYDATDYFLKKFNLHINAATDIACGLQLLHTHHMAHRDMKPENVLVSSLHGKKLYVN